MDSLHLKMENEATVSDWLGTASVAAELAANRLKAIREGDADFAQTIQIVSDDLNRALDEVNAVALRVSSAREWQATQAMVADMERDGLL